MLRLPNTQETASSESSAAKAAAAPTKRAAGSPPRRAPWPSVHSRGCPPRHSSQPRRECSARSSVPPCLQQHRQYRQQSRRGLAHGRASLCGRVVLAAAGPHKQLAGFPARLRTCADPPPRGRPPLAAGGPHLQTRVTSVWGKLVGWLAGRGCRWGSCSCLKPGPAAEAPLEGACVLLHTLHTLLHTSQ